MERLQNTNLRALTERIFWLPASDRPLSSDVGIIRGDRCDWVFDAGSSDEAAALISALRPERNLVISHFHADHTANLRRVSWSELYCGSYTAQKLQLGTAVQAPAAFLDGAELTVFPLPSTHSKGAVGLAVGEDYAFLGDAVYGAEVQGREAYNANLLSQMLAVLEPLNVRWFLLSHDPVFSRPKAEVISGLKALYRTRRPGDAYVFAGAPE